jgi:hypothetical protein
VSLDQLRLLAGAVGGLALLLVAVSAAGGPVAGVLGRLAARAREDLSPVADTTDRALDDMRFVLEMAHRLAADGRPDAVKLCQQLIDEMLRVKPAGVEAPK